MKSLKTSCLKCHKRGEVLVCSNQGCPTVVHESCMPCVAHFDDKGCFYCPYCLYKQSLVERDQAREKALLARQSLVGFLDTRIRNDAGHLNNSNSLKRKRPEAPTIVKERKDASSVKDDFNQVHQQEHLKHQDESNEKAAVFLVRNECESLPCTETKNMSLKYPQDEQAVDKQVESQECFPRSERVNNLGNADQSVVIGNDCNGSAERTVQENARQDPVKPTWEGKTEVIHELGNRTRKHPISPKKLEKCLNGVEDIKQKVSELPSTRGGDKKEEAEEFGTEKCSSVQDECFLKRERRLCGKNVDRTACIREGRHGKTIEGQLETVKNAPNMTENENASVSNEEFGSVDDTESRNTDYLPHRLHAVKKRQIKKNLKNVAQHGESSGCSENDFATHGESNRKVKSIKQIQQSTTFPNARRKKLPWMVQEVEMLEEGVKTFSLKVNKNIPWLKILEYGRHVFDGTRTSADLKDKWKLIKAKKMQN